MSEAGHGGESTLLSRRRFIRDGLATVAVVGLGLSAVGGEPAAADEQSDSAYGQPSDLAGNTGGDQSSDTSAESAGIVADETTDKPNLFSVWKIPHAYEDFTDPNQSLLKTVGQAYVNLGATAVCEAALDVVGVETSDAYPMNLSVSERFDELPPFRQAAGKLLFERPLGEEGAYRLVPSVLLDFVLSRVRKDYESTSGLFPVAVLGSLFYAHMYNVESGQSGLPLSRFMSSMLTWRQLRSAGLDHAVVSHTAANLPAVPYVARKLREVAANHSPGPTEEGL